MKIPWWQLALVLIGLVFFAYHVFRKKSFDGGGVALTKIDLPALTIALPDWKAEEDERGAGLGRIKVVHKPTSAFAEVSWQGGAELNADELRELGKSVVDGFRMNVTKEVLDSTEEHHRFSVEATIGGGKNRVWMAMMLFQCRRTNVTVTVGVGARQEEEARALSQRIGETFSCRGDDPAGFRLTAEASSTLPAEFGFAKDGDAHILAAADGRSVSLFHSAGNVAKGARDHTDKLIATFSQLLGIEITATAKARETAGLGGVSIRAVPASASDGMPIAFGIFFCKKQGITFLTLAMDETNQATSEQLIGLFSAIGCPEAGPLASKRQSACDVGVKAFCEE